jgi:hypothetical protein
MRGEARERGRWSPRRTRRAALVVGLALLVVPARGEAQVARGAQGASRRPVRAEGTPTERVARREYLQRLVLVLDGVRRTLRWVETHPGNEGLARFAAPLAQQYVAMTGHMRPPADLRLVHPHVLRIVENTEAALTALAGGDARAYRAHLRTVREEQRALQSLMHHLSVELPEIPR